MKRLLFVNIFILFTTQYPMKRSNEHMPLSIVHNLLDVKAHTGVFRYLSNDILRMLLVMIVKDQPNHKSSMIALDRVSSINQWFKEFINKEKKSIFETFMTPVEYAAMTGQVDNFAFEKVFNKAQLYGTFIDNSSSKKRIIATCVIHPKVKKILVYSLNVVDPYLNPDGIINYASGGERYEYDDTSCLHLMMKDQMSLLIKCLAAEKQPSLTPAQLEILKLSYGDQDTYLLLKNLYTDFTFTVAHESYLHLLFDNNKKIQSGLFRQLVEKNGNILSQDTDGKTFIEKAIKNTAYDHITKELISFSDVQNYLQKNPQIRYLPS